MPEPYSTWLTADERSKQIDYYVGAINELHKLSRRESGDVQETRARLVLMEHELQQLLMLVRHALTEPEENKVEKVLVIR